VEEAKATGTDLEDQRAERAIVARSLGNYESVSERNAAKSRVKRAEKERSERGTSERSS
jgi:hypothetical protein